MTVTNNLKTMLRLEYAAVALWSELSRSERRAYVLAYPGTRMAKASETDDEINPGFGDDEEIVDAEGDGGEWNPHQGFPSEMRSATRKGAFAGRHQALAVKPGTSGAPVSLTADNAKRSAEYRMRTAKNPPKKQALAAADRALRTSTHKVLSSGGWTKHSEGEATSRTGNFFRAPPRPRSQSPS